MNWRGPFSPEALGNLVAWVPSTLREKAWSETYNIYIARAPTLDGTEKEYAAEQANRFWPNYLPPPPTEEPA